ncbi:MAG: hypothetical protein J6Y79_01885 [Paludibacteraceae bacterium]|nr:hypothetical protein [Paludibacteraceae bacterium]
MLKREPYNWEEEYEKKLPAGLRAAGWFIQKYFQDRNIKYPAMRWIQTRLTYPAFQYLCFAYAGNIYSVLIEFYDGNASYVLDRDLSNQIRECKANDLIPCTIVLRSDNYEPVIDGNHLILSDKHTPVAFKKREGDVRMSAWEINNFGVSIVMQDLEKEGNKIMSFCDVLNIEPQIWFEDKNGNRCYVIVNTISGSTKENTEYQINHNLLMRFINYNGFYAEVNILPNDLIAKDENGRVLMPSERFDSKNPKEILYRDHQFYINYRGLKYIEKQAAEKGVTHKKTIRCQG